MAVLAEFERVHTQVLFGKEKHSASSLVTVESPQGTAIAAKGADQVKT